MGRKKNPTGSCLSSPQYEPSLPVEHSEIAIRLNQDIFRIKIEKQANKEIMYADDILLLASLTSALRVLKEQKEMRIIAKRLFQGAMVLAALLLSTNIPKELIGMANTLPAYSPFLLPSLISNSIFFQFQIQPVDTDQRLGLSQSLCLGTQ